MRIHFLVRSLRQEGAGSHQNALSYIRYLKERGHSVTVHAITSFNNPPADISIIAHAKEKLGFIAGNTFLTQLLFMYEKDADIFFLYGVDCIWGAGSYRKSGGTTPVAIYLDTCLSTMDTGQRLSTLYYMKRLIWEKLFGMREARGVDAYIASSPFIKEEYVRSGFPVKKFNIVSNFFEFSAKHAVQENQGSPPVQMISVGRLTYEKGIDLLIEAIKDIDPKLYELRIVGAGKSKFEDTCKQMIRDYGLEGRISMIPWIDPKKIHEVYEGADVLVHPSRIPEAFGRIFVEAMSHEIPVIASNIGAAPWVIGNAGTFFQNGNVHELRQAIVTLIQNKSLRRQLGEVGIPQSQKFSKEVVGPHLERVLESIVH